MHGLPTVPISSFLESFALGARSQERQEIMEAGEILTGIGLLMEGLGTHSVLLVS